MPGATFGLLVDDDRADRFKPGDASRELEWFRRSHGDWTAIHAMAPTDDAPTFHALARDAGVHHFSNTDDVLYANRSLVVRHAPEAGPKRLRFPAATDVEDLVGGKTREAVREVTLTRRKGDTFLLK